MTVDHKRPLKKADVLPGSRTTGDWGLESDYSVVIGRQVCIPIEQCGPDGSPLAERKANALRLANAAALEDALWEMVEASNELGKASVNTPDGTERVFGAHQRWLAAKARANELLERVRGESPETTRETATFVGNELRNRPANEAARQLRDVGVCCDLCGRSASSYVIPESGHRLGQHLCVPCFQKHAAPCGRSRQVGGGE